MENKLLSDRIAELEQLIGEAYQIVGAMAHELWLTNIETERVLDNLSQARSLHNNVLPFYATSPRIAGLERANTALWADKERMDWIATALRGGSLEAMRIEYRYYMPFRGFAVVTRDYGANTDYLGKDLREAIDKARLKGSFVKDGTTKGWMRP